MAVMEEEPAKYLALAFTPLAKQERESGQVTYRIYDAHCYFLFRFRVSRAFPVYRETSLT